MHSTLSTTMSTNKFTISGCSLVPRLVLAMFNNMFLSQPSHYIFIVSKNLSSSTLASSQPSQMTLGCTPSCTKRSACLIRSPVNNTLLVVPSPTMSSCAVAERAIIAAVGCYIYISFNNTFPSFVNFICPAPPTNIFKVPLGPKLDFITSCSDPAATMFIERACILRTTSALSLSYYTADITNLKIFYIQNLYSNKKQLTISYILNLNFIIFYITITFIKTLQVIISVILHFQEKILFKIHIFNRITPNDCNFFHTFDDVL